MTVNILKPISNLREIGEYTILNLREIGDFSV